MKSFLMSIYTVALLATGFYARGCCQPVTLTQHQNDIQVASVIPQDQQDAFTKLAAHLNNRGK